MLNVLLFIVGYIVSLALVLLVTEKSRKKLRNELNEGRKRLKKMKEALREGSEVGL